ncbi:DNA mismatch repair protein MutL [Colletes latitarsis]|uniref:DNA mismatch repair protein MutL n=1 Tax=Colletes latitarsis TaxID=2605962 RepID=UPI004035688E
MSNVISLPECVLELVLNSLNANATAIAIRIDANERKIQVVDNGIGITKERLKTIAEYNEQRTYWNVQDICNSRKQTLVNIRRLSDAMLITSRYYNSFKTFIKVFKIYHSPDIISVRTRPSHGTTVSIYGFHELTLDKWNIPLMSFLVANTAIVNLQVSFSIRDNQKNKVIMIITKPHRPIEILKLLYNREISVDNLHYIESTKDSDTKFSAYIGLTNTKLTAKQYIFLNNRPVHCPFILQMISTIVITTIKCFATARYWQIPKKEAIFILLFITCEEYFFTVEKGTKTLILPRVQDLLQNIRNEITNIFAKNTMPLFNNVSNHVREHNNSIYSYANASFPQKLFASKQNCVLHTLCHVIRRKVTELNVPPIHENLIEKQNPSTVDCFDPLKVNNVNSQERYINNKSRCEVVTNRLNANEITDAVQLFTPVSRSNNVMKESITLTISEWSNWTYHDNESYNSKKINKFNDNSRVTNFYKHFDFLPKKLHKLLRGNTKLTKIDILNESCGSVLSTKLKFGLPISDTLFHQEMDVRLCKVVQRFREFRLKKDLLKFVKILGQVNNELIVGLVIKNDAKVLLLMDQHAIHERIRYENLIHKYKSEMRNQLFPIKLRDPVIIQLPVDKCNLLLSNTMQLKKFGISLSITNDNSVMVHTVPECLKKNKYYYNEIKLKLSVQNLLNEILQNITNNKDSQINDVPLVIHNAIAMEACHVFKLNIVNI